MSKNPLVIPRFIYKLLNRNYEKITFHHLPVVLLVEKRFRGELNKCQGCAICK